MKDPPQAMMTMLDNLQLLQAKCSAGAFREGKCNSSPSTRSHSTHWCLFIEVLPLVYNALDADIAPLLDKALRIIPNLSEGLDVGLTARPGCAPPDAIFYSIRQ